VQAHQSNAISRTFQHYRSVIVQLSSSKLGAVKVQIPLLNKSK